MGIGMDKIKLLQIFKQTKKINIQQQKHFRKYEDREKAEIKLQNNNKYKDFKVARHNMKPNAQPQ